MFTTECVVDHKKVLKNKTTTSTFPILIQINLHKNIYKFIFLKLYVYIYHSMRAKKYKCT